MAETNKARRKYVSYCPGGVKRLRQGQRGIHNLNPCNDGLYKSTLLKQTSINKVLWQHNKKWIHMDTLSDRVLFVQLLVQKI